jgi:hypothetical protein
MKKSSHDTALPSLKYDVNGANVHGEYTIVDQCLSTRRAKTSFRLQSVNEPVSKNPRDVVS